VVGAQLCILSPVNAHAVAMKPVYEKITRHYLGYCTVAICWCTKCELSYMCPGHVVKLHPYLVKCVLIRCVGSALVLSKVLT